MLIEQPPLIYRMFYPEALWRIPASTEPAVYLTFDDGPIPEVTPRVLDILDEYGAKATFFMVGENVLRHPELLDEVRRRGHAVGNHTMRHLQGIRTPTREYLRDVARARAIIDSPLFRPPHGLMRPAQARAISRQMQIVMHDVVTCDYSARLTPAQVLDNIKRYTRPGSIIVFHDSLRALPRLLTALPAALTHLLTRGYTLPVIPSNSVGF